MTLRYKSHRTKKQEDLVITSDEFITLFASHVPEKWFHMIRYYGFLSPSARMRKMLTEVVYPSRVSHRHIKFQKWLKSNG
nr:transposase [Candidatus Arsenophonus triatominarum]